MSDEKVTGAKSVMAGIAQRQFDKMKAEAALRAGQKPATEVEAKEQQAKPVAPKISATQPIRTSEQETVYKSTRPTMNFFLSDGTRVMFKHGFLMTDDPDVKKHIEKNFLGGMVSVVEDGPLKVG